MIEQNNSDYHEQLEQKVYYNRMHSRDTTEGLSRRPVTIKDVELFASHLKIGISQSIGYSIIELVNKADVAEFFVDFYHNHMRQQNGLAEKIKGKEFSEIYKNKQIKDILGALPGTEVIGYYDDLSKLIGISLPKKSDSLEDTL
jgi:hypothetical protein